MRGGERRTISTGRIRLSLSSSLELIGERFVVKEGPWVVELVVPCSLEVPHTRDHVVQLAVPDEGQQGGGGEVRLPRTDNLSLRTLFWLE